MKRSDMIYQLSLAVFLVLSLLSGTECQQGVPGSVLLPPQRPLCMSQIALVNHACSLLPVVTFSPPTHAYPAPPSVANPFDDGPSGDGSSPLPPPPPPFVPIPPPSVSYPPDPIPMPPSGYYPNPGIYYPPNLTPPNTAVNIDDNNNGLSGHANRQNPRDGHTHENLVMNPVEAECCRWLWEVDQQCVCDVLARLPVFLTRPLHDYHVRIADACSVPFYCGGRYRA